MSEADTSDEERSEGVGLVTEEGQNKKEISTESVEDDAEKE